MIPAGFVTSLTSWAKGNSTRIAQLTTERDALVTGFLTGGTDSKAITTGSVNGKTFGAVVNLSREDKLAVLTRVLTNLGEIADPEPSVTYPDFSELSR